MPWFEKAKEVHAKNPELTYDEVAAKFGRSGKTYGNRIYEERRVKKAISQAIDGNVEHVNTDSYEIKEVDNTYYIKGLTHSCSVTKEQLRRIKVLYCEQGMTAKQTSREMEILLSDFNLIRRAFNITHDDVPYIDEDLLEYSTDELVQKSVKRKKKEYFTKLRQQEIDNAFRELNKYRKKDYFYTKLLEGLKSNMEKAQATKQIKTPVKKTSEKKTLVLNLADIHKGKFIAGSSIPTANNYNKTVFYKRLEKIIAHVRNMLENTQFDRFYIINYGDSLDDPDAMTYNKQILNQYASGENQVVEYIAAMTNLLTKLLEYSNIHYIGVPGNHSKNIINWDNLANQLLEFAFRDNKNITFECTDRASKVIKIYDSSIVITHGNHISNSQSKGQIDTLNIFRMYGLNSKKTYLIQGHLHHYEGTKYRRILLPSMCGPDDYAENILNISSRPAQLICVFTEEGLSEEHHVYLD